MKNTWLFSLFFSLFLISRLFYLYLDPHVSDTDLYGRYSYFFLKGLSQGENPYESYRLYRNKEGKRGGVKKKEGFLLSLQNKTKRPYIETRIEYPPLALVWMSLPGFFVFAKYPKAQLNLFVHLYQKVYRWFMLFWDCLFFLLFFWISYFLLRRKRDKPSKLGFYLSFFIICGLCNFIYYYYRLDYFLSFLIFLSGVSLFYWKKRILSFLLLALAINFKLVPLILVPLWCLFALPIKESQILFDNKKYFLLLKKIFFNFCYVALFSLFIFIPFYLVFGSQTLDFLKYHSGRPIQIESFYSNFSNFFRVFGFQFKVYMSHGSVGISSSLNTILMKLSPYIMIASFSVFYLFVLWFTFNRLGTRQEKTKISKEESYAERYPQVFFSVTVLLILLSLITFKVFSPQFILWFCFFVPFCDFSSGKKIFEACFLTIVFSLLSSYIYPYAYFHFNVAEGLTPYGLFLLSLRNTLVLVFFYRLFSQTFKKKLMM